MIDGVSGVDLTMVLHDLKPDAAPPAPPAAPWQPRAIPDPLTLLQDAVTRPAHRGGPALTDDAFRLLRPTELEARLRQLAGAVGVLRPEPAAPGAARAVQRADLGRSGDSAGRSSRSASSGA